MSFGTGPAAGLASSGGTGTAAGLAASDGTGFAAGLVGLHGIGPAARRAASYGNGQATGLAASDGTGLLRDLVRDLLRCTRRSPQPDSRSSEEGLGLRRSMRDALLPRSVRNVLGFSDGNGSLRRSARDTLSCPGERDE